MPYLAILDEHGKELTLPRQDMSDVQFKVSPPSRPGAIYTLINTSLIEFKSLQTDPGDWAAQIGVCDDVDTPPIVVVPLLHGRLMVEEDGLVIVPGQLVLDMLSIRPTGRAEPEPRPADWQDQLMKLRRLVW